MEDKNGIEIRLGNDEVELICPGSEPNVGTVTQVARQKVRVLLPIRKFAWFYSTEVKRTGRTYRIIHKASERPSDL